MATLKMQADELSASLSKIQEGLGNFTKTANSIAEQSDILSQSSVWQGKKASKLNAGLESFLPNIAIAYNMMEKSKNDLTACVNSMVNHDQK